MIPFIGLPHIVQGILLAAMLNVFIFGMVCLTVSLLYKVSAGSIVPITVLCIAEIIIQWLLADGIKEYFCGMKPTTVARIAGSIPYFAVIVYLLMTLFLTVFYALRLVRFIRLHITAMSVKESIDKIPAGLCFYAESGLLLLVNYSMEYICRTATHKGLLDGTEFWNAVSKGKIADDAKAVHISDTPVIKLPDGTVKSFERKKLTDGASTVYELIAYDVTEQYALSVILDEENRKLKEMNSRLREYGNSVTELTREKEILSAKVQIHDRIGKLLLMSKKQLVCGGDTDERNDLITALKQNNILMSASENSGSDYEDLLKSSELVGVKITLSGNLPDNEIIGNIFLTAIHECLTNTVSHADGKNLYAEIEDNGTYFRLTCSNDGKRPDSVITEGGGLSDLRALAEKENGKMTVVSLPEFKLIIEMPKERKK